MPFASGFVDFLTVIWMFHVKHFFWIMCIPECDFSELEIILLHFLHMKIHFA